MAGVISGSVIIAALVLVGVGLGVSGVLGDNGRFVLNRLTYFVAGPALVFDALLGSELSLILSDTFVIAAVVSLVTAALGFGATRWLCQSPPGIATVAAISGAMVNSANMGFPIAQYVLGDVAHALPVALWQMAFFTPAFQFVLHSIVSGSRPSLRSFAKSILANPMIVAAIVGVCLLAAKIQPPSFIAEPIGILAGMSIPGMLLAFGMSLTASRPFSAQSGLRKEIVVASFFKLAVMPTLAYIIATVVLHAGPATTYASVVLAALPTAQNVYVAAAHYETGEELARDVALFTSIGTVAVLLTVTAALGPAAVA